MAAISLSTLIAGVDDIQLGIFVQQLKQAASELSEQMGHGIPI